MSVVKNNLCAVFLQPVAPPEKLTEKLSPDPLALLCMQRPAAGADPEELRKVTEWDNTGHGDFPSLLCPLTGLKASMIETAPYLSDMSPGCYFVNWIMSCSVHCLSQHCYPTTFSHLPFYSSVPPHFSDSTLESQQRTFYL